jgi:hypothetical protein
MGLHDDIGSVTGTAGGKGNFYSHNCDGPWSAMEAVWYMMGMAVHLRRSASGWKAAQEEHAKEPSKMKRVLFAFLIILFLSIRMSSQDAQDGTALNENLKVLEPMLHKNWVGDMKSPDGMQTFKVSLSCEPIWNGEVIKYSRSNPERNTFSEGYFYWDVSEKKITFLSVSNRGGAMKADVSMEDGKISFKGSATVQNRTFEYRNTFEFTSDGKMVDRWFQNASGSWQPGHVIEFIKK